MIRSAKRSRRHGPKPANGRLLRAETLEPRLALSAVAAWQQVVSAPLQVGAAPKASAEVTLRPVADAAVKGAAPITNFGKTGNLLVKSDSSPTAYDDSEAYLKFDLSAVNAPIAKAVLKLTPRSRGWAASSLAIGVELLDDVDDGWVEGDGGTNADLSGPITWFNSPYSVGDQVKVAGRRFRPWTPISIDVTSLLKQSFNVNQVASFELLPVSAPGAGRWINFVSRENGNVDLRPVLVVTTGPSVAPRPSVAQQPAASNLTDTGVQLAVLGTVAGGEQNLAYSWSVISPAGATAPTFSDNGANSSKNTSVTFRQAGTYIFTATITDLTSRLWVRSNPVSVTVSPSLASIQVTPSSVALNLRATQQFAARGLDQFGQAIAGSVAGVTWSVAGAGTINSAGLYTAPSASSVDTVTARAGSLSATARVTVEANSLGLKDAALGSLVDALDADGSIDRDDMLAIFRSSYVTTSGVLTSDDFADLKTILGDAASLNMPGYVQVLSSDVINGNRANAWFQGASLGNLAVGSSAAQLDKLVSKWFLGADHPATGGYGYSTVSGPLFASAGPSHLDEHQGNVGDCYLISALGSIADSSQAAIRNMFVENGVDTVINARTWTVRFYADGVADYVTVDDMLPTNGRGGLVFQGAGSTASNPQGLWLALAEKAYVQWNETGKEGRDGRNRYASIEAGWMSDVNAQVLGRDSTTYNVSTSSDQQALVAAVTGRKAVTIGTISSGRSGGSLAFGLVGGHAYNVTAYNSTAKTFTLYNPWGTDQPTKALTWAEIKTVSDGFVVADPSGTTPIATGFAAATLRPVIAPRPATQTPAAIDRAVVASDADANCRDIAPVSRPASWAVDAALTQPASVGRVARSASAAASLATPAIAPRSTLVRGSRSDPPSRDLVTLAIDEIFQSV